MTKSPHVDPSTRLLSEVARHVVIPDGIVDTLWFDVEERCREFGDEFDAWQDGLGQVALGLREDGMFAATVGGITLSIPRQVAKTFIVMRIVVALCTLHPNLTVIWTAHRLRTSTNTFQKMKTYVMRPAVRHLLKPGSNQGTAIRDANGEQEIPFKNGSVIMIGARGQGFGRGFDEVDIEVFDEAQILTEQALDDMVPASNQSRFKHGALLFYMGTPPRPTDPGEVFTLRRDEALAFKSDDDEFGQLVVGDDSLYVECSADQGCDPDDHAQWAKANPSYPHRTPLVSLLRMRKNLPAVDSWRREALGVWDVIDDIDDPFARWDLLADTDSLPTDESLRLALDMPYEATSATFSIAGRRPDGMAHVSMRLHVPPAGLNDVVATAKTLTEGHGVPLVIPHGSPVLAYRSELVEAGIELDVLTAAETAEAFGALKSKAMGLTVRHRGQPELTNAVRGIVSRKSADVDMPSRRSSAVNIAPALAAMVALARVPDADVSGPAEPVFIAT